jgi:hypothetical protein
VICNALGPLFFAPLLFAPSEKSAVVMGVAVVFVSLSVEGGTTLAVVFAVRQFRAATRAFLPWLILAGSFAGGACGGYAGVYAVRAGLGIHHPSIDSGVLLVTASCLFAGSFLGTLVGTLYLRRTVAQPCDG